MGNVIYCTAFELVELGTVLLMWNKVGITHCLLCEDLSAAQALQRRLCRDALWWSGAHPYVRAVLEQLSGSSSSQRQLPLDVSAGTPFQQRVWRVIQRVPFGQTMTYQQVGQAIGTKSLARAVGQACGRNPLALVIPCHRILSTNGQLGGYAWGIARKQWLLTYEQSRSAQLIN